MSGRQAKKQRQSEKDLQSEVSDAIFAIETAQRMLALDMSSVPLTRAAQFIVGWLRAAFAQSRAIAILTSANLSSAAAPNRRSFAEIVVRLLWVHDLPGKDRSGAMDAMIDEEKEQTLKFVKHLDDMGVMLEIDLTDMDNLVTESIEDPRIRHQARNFIDAAKSTEGRSAGLYYSWREETQYTHATGALAAAYAPDVRGELGAGQPPVVDPTLTTHRTATLLVVTLAYGLLVEEGVEQQDATRIVDAFFGT
jgi:hypothetical protein